MLSVWTNQVEGQVGGPYETGRHGNHVRLRKDGIGGEDGEESE